MMGKGFLWGIIVVILILAGCGQDQGENDEIGPGNDEEIFSAGISEQTSAPQTYLKKSSLPANPSDSTSANFKFRCNQSPCEFKCKLDSNPWKKCKSPKSYSSLAVGSHTFKVKAGKNGVWDRSPANYTWVISFGPAYSLSAGGYHTCAITGSSAVKCWGRNDDGQLGDGTRNDRDAPVDVSGLSSGIKGLFPGISHTCALTTSDSVKCWGWNIYGQLGDGTTITRKLPVNVSGLSSGIMEITAGNHHTCGLTTSNAVKCWGGNFYGQLGDGTNTDHYAPVDVSGLSSGISAISAGASYTCALTCSGGVKCWGYNYYGQLGDGTNDNRYSPVDVSGLSSGIVEISAGWNHTCALTASGGVKCWGNNSSGQLGNGNNSNSNVPVDVSGLSSGVFKISAGASHTCAVTDSNIKCWGSNSTGQLGDGTNTNRKVPVDVSGLSSGIAEISTKGSHTCAQNTSGVLKCWGYNLYGELGNETNDNSNVPVDVIGFGP